MLKWGKSCFLLPDDVVIDQEQSTKMMFSHHAD